MGVIDYILIAMGIFLLGGLAAARRDIRYQRSSMEHLSTEIHTALERLEGFRDQIQRVESKLDEMELKLDEIEYNTLSEAERESLKFDSAKDLTLIELRNTKQGDILRLIVRDTCYPFDGCTVERLDYRHDHINEESLSKYGYEIHGYTRRSATEDWTPFRFLSSEKESQTSSCSGTVKRLP